VAESRGLILNVDDYEASRYARSQMLQRAGFQVIEAGTGAESIRLASERRPDLVLLDVNLPDMDGFEVCRRLRAQAATLTVPIVHISATFLSDRAEELAYEGGADSYLTDPVEPAVLLATIHSLLRLRRAEEGLRAASRSTARPPIWSGGRGRRSGGGSAAARSRRRPRGWSGAGAARPSTCTASSAGSACWWIRCWRVSR